MIWESLLKGKINVDENVIKLGFLLILVLKNKD